MRFHLVVYLLCSLCLSNSWAGDNAWTQLNLPEGGGGSLSLDDSTSPSTLIASSRSQYYPYNYPNPTPYYQSADKGETWSPFLPSTTDVSYRIDFKFYKQVGVDGEWVEVIADEGFSLPPIYFFSSFLNQPYSRILRIAPTKPATIYVVLTPQTDYPSREMYRSSDGGKRWYKIYPSQQSSSIHFLFNSFSVDPSSPDTLYILGTPDEEAGAVNVPVKLYVSTDAGENWRVTAHPAFKIALDNIEDRVDVFAPLYPRKLLDAVATTPTSLYVNSSLYNTVDKTSHILLLKTTPERQSWSTISLPPELDHSLNTDVTLNYIRIVPSTTGRLYLLWRNKNNQIASLNYEHLTDNYEEHFYKTVDDGAHWTTLSSDLFSYLYPSYNLLLDPENNDILYLDIGSSILKSVDAGEHWKSLTQGLKLQNVDNIFNSATALYAYANGELFQSKDKGQTWINTQLLYPSMRFVAANTTPEAIKTYSYTKDCHALFVKQLGREAVVHPLPEAFYKCQTVKISLNTVRYNEKTLYVFMPSDANDPNHATPQLLKSTDDGATWTVLYTLMTQRNLTLVPDPVMPKKLYAVVEKLGIVHSTDDGTTWSVLNGGTFENGQLSIVPTTPRTLYMMTGAALFKSIDDGLNWTELKQGLPTSSIAPLLIGPENPNVLYLNTRKQVYKSINAGNTWCPVTPLNAADYMFDTPSLEAIVANFADANTFLAQSSGKIISYTTTTDKFVNSLGVYKVANVNESTNNPRFTGHIQRPECEQAGVMENIPSSSNVVIRGSIEPLPEQIGQVADIIVAVSLSTPQSSDSLYLTLGENGLQAWDNINIANAVPFKRGVSLQAKNEFTLYQGTFGIPGQFYINFGYRLADGTWFENNQSLVAYSY